jgi:hypothetical protein
MGRHRDREVSTSFLASGGSTLKLPLEARGSLDLGWRLSGQDGGGHLLFLDALDGVVYGLVDMEVDYGLLVGGVGRLDLA